MRKFQGDGKESETFLSVTSQPGGWRRAEDVIQGYTLGCNGWLEHGLDVTFRPGGGHGGWPTSWGMDGCMDARFGCWDSYGRVGTCS